MKKSNYLIILIVFLFTVSCKKGTDENISDSFTIIQKKIIEGKYEGVFGGKYFCKTSDGGYAIFTRKFYSSVVLIKVDSNFNFEWERTYSGSGIQEKGVIAPIDGNILTLSMYFKSSPTDSSTFQVEKLDTEGNLLWSFRSEINGGVASYSEAKDGALFILWQKKTNPEDPTAKFNILKLSANGEEICTNNFSVKKRQGLIDTETTNNNDIIFIQSNYICKVTELGEKLWEDTLSNSVLTYVISDSLENIITVGQRYWYDPNQLDHYDLLVVKYDKQGNKLWERTFNNGTYELSLDICIGYDGNYIIPGISYNPDLGVLFKVNSIGNKFYERNIDFGRRDNCVSVVKSNGRYVLLGTYKGTPNEDSSTIYLMEFIF